VLVEDVLKHLFEFALSGQPATLDSLAGALVCPPDRLALLLPQMQSRGLLEFEGGAVVLTSSGREYALHILRAHRLWERHLSDQTGYPESEWHDRAEDVEHTLTPADLNVLAQQLGNPTHDPHGDPIPAPTGEVAAVPGAPLACATGDHLRIVHIEDEPRAIYAQLIAEGLRPGMYLRVLERAPDRIVVWAMDREHVLAPIVANNLTVVPVRTPPAPAERQRRLSALRLGERARVVAISKAIRGPARRRLMDLGLLPGTLVEAALSSPSGDPTAYLVRGAAIALRREQTDEIVIAASEGLAP
jgi:DtxR family Mn-dependent transcriptional regulator